MKISPNTRQNLLAIGLLIGIAAIAYLAFAHLFGYYVDDWYVVYAVVSQGVQKLKDIFASDRPFRAVHMGLMFNLFGTNPWLFSLSAFALRCLGAVGVLWIFRTIWPRQRQATFLAALLFLIYPGFRDLPNAIDYQSHLLSFTLAIFSIAFTVKAILSPKVFGKAAWLAASVAAQILYLLLMEYYIGLEGLRLILIVYLVWRSGEAEWSKRIGWIFLYWSPALLTAAGFLFWRTQIFQGARSATDVNSMFIEVGNSPLMRLLWMGVALVKDLFSTIFVAWAEPVYHYAFSQRLKLILLELGLALLAGLLAWLALRLVKDVPETPTQPTSQSKTARDMAVIGLLAAALALIPVHLGSRQVDFDNFSRFTLTPSIGVALIIAGGYVALGVSRVKVWLATGLVVVAALAQVSNSLIHVQTWQTMRNFWWQIAWRAPQIEPGTVIMASYPGVSINEDYFVWGPANLIYYPKLEPGAPSKLKINGATLSLRDIKSAIQGGEDLIDRRSIISERDFKNLLVIAQPGEAACVQVLDGNNPELSEDMRAEIMLVAPYSRADRIEVNEQPQTPPLAIFGQEPAHDWCYYYQKAALARQQGAWETVASLAKQAEQAGLSPVDRIEWMPFIEAYARQGDLKNVRNLAAILRASPFYKQQACQLIQADPHQLSQAAPEAYSTLLDQLCKKN